MKNDNTKFAQINHFIPIHFSAIEADTAGYFEDKASEDLPLEEIENVSNEVVK